MASPAEIIRKTLIVGESDAMRRVLDSIPGLAEQDTPALIEGERGTGRELVARVIHFAGPRRDSGFVSVKAGATPKTLFEVEFAGSAGGALQLARGGTLLVKNLASLPRTGQRKLSRVLRKLHRRRAAASAARGIDVRILGSCDADLTSAVAADVFSRDLYDRLGVYKVTIPPLRERVADIPPLTAHFVRLYAREIGRGRVKLSARAVDRLVTYPWPGNVAELKDVSRRLVIRTPRARIEAGDVDQVLPVVAERVPLEDMSFESMVRSKLGSFLKRVEGYPIVGFYDDVIARVERPLLDLVMEHTGGNQLRAAEILGVNRNTLRKKLAQHGIKSRRDKSS